MFIVFANAMQYATTSASSSCGDFLGLGPLKMFHQLGRFDRDRHAQILRRMELLPIPFVSELRDGVLHLLNRCR